MYLNTHLIFFDEVTKRGPLDLNGLTGPIVQRNDEMEKVWFAQIAGGLLFEVGPADADPANKTQPFSTRLTFNHPRTRWPLTGGVQLNPISTSW